jgi:two-component system, LytTR family, response regulator
MESEPLRAYVLDDEPLAIERLERLLGSAGGFRGGLRIVGRATDPAQALDFLNRESVDVLFLDIQMPGMNGFELLSRLNAQPFVIFTTAFDEFALKAFEVNSIDYLMKPIEPEQLARALKKFDLLRLAAKQDWQQNPELPTLLKELAASLRGERAEYPRRIASRVGERISFLELDAVTHFVAQDKLTYAVVNGRRHCVDQSIAELEQRLDPTTFLRVHRSALVNVDWIHEVNSWFAGKVVLSLKDAQHTQLPVARDRVRSLKSLLNI